MSARALIFAGAMAALAPAAAWSQVPAGPPFQVNTYTTGRQAYPHVAIKADGEFVVVWDHRVQYGTTPSDVHARRFAPGGAPLGDEFLVNAFTDSAQTVVGGGGIGLDARGNAVVAWDEFRNGVDVFARRLSASGTPVGDDFQVNLPGVFQAGATRPLVAPDGRFVVAWKDLIERDVLARRFDASGTPLGPAFRVNTYTTGKQVAPAGAVDGAGNFIVTWDGYNQDGPVSSGVFAQRYAVSGAPIGGEFQVNTFTTNFQGGSAVAMNHDGAAVVAWEGAGPVCCTQIWAQRYASGGAPVGDQFAVTAVPGSDAAQTPAVAMDDAGNFVVAWMHYVAGPSPFGLTKLRRFTASGTPRGGELLVATPSAYFVSPKIASDPVGNFVVAWHDASPDDREVIAQRFGGLFPAGLGVVDGNNGVFELGESATLPTSWRNLTGASQAFQGQITAASSPDGLILTLVGAANYGLVASGAVGACGATCFGGALAGTRPAGHVDTSFVETLVPDAQGQAKKWVLHVGGSFPDVASTNPFYRFVETLLHRGVTAGCANGNYCPAASTTRQEMSVFVLVAREGAGYAPPACTAPPFSDVPVSSPFCRYIQELVLRGVSGGCGGDGYCPNDAVTREQMAVFVLRTLDPTFDPQACGTPVFSDVPATSPFCRWIEELARRGVVAGCGGGKFCPTSAVTREQMSVFLSGTFGLTLYGP